MAKKVKLTESEGDVAHPDIPDTTNVVDKPVETVENLEAPPKIYATKMELGVGAHLLGQTLTLAASRGSTLEVTTLGVHAVSVSGRVVLIPWANIKCIELSPAKSKIRRK